MNCREAFRKLDIRAGKIVKCEPNAKAHKPSYKIWIDFGPHNGFKQSSAQLVAAYQTPQDLVGRTIFAVCNFEKKKIAGFESQVLVLGFIDVEGKVRLMQAAKNESASSPGSKIFLRDGNEDSLTDSILPIVPFEVFEAAKIYTKDGRVGLNVDDEDTFVPLVVKNAHGQSVELSMDHPELIPDGACLCWNILS